MNENTEDRFTIYDKVEMLRKKVLGKTRDQQTIEYAKLPVTANGRGHFQFELNQYERGTPPPDRLSETLIKHFDFDLQRTALKEGFRANRNDFNLFTIGGKCFDSQHMLCKALFNLIITLPAFGVQSGLKPCFKLYPSTWMLPERRIFGQG